MKNYLFRILVGIKAFAFGVFIVYLIALNNSPVNYCELKSNYSNDANNVVERNVETGRIDVKFSRFIKTKQGNFIEFSVNNNSAYSFFYNSNSASEEKLQDVRIRALKLDGELTNIRWGGACYYDLEENEIKSGETKIFKVYSGALISEWKKDKKLQIGFKFNKSLPNEYPREWNNFIVWSDELPETVEFDNILSRLNIENERKRLDEIKKSSNQFSSYLISPSK